MGGRGGASSSGGGSSSFHKYIPETNGRDAITRKQGGVIYRAFKTGELNATKAQMNMVYGRFVDDSPRRTTDSHVQNGVTGLRTVVSALSAGDSKAANAAFDHFLNKYYRNFKDSMYPDDRRKRKR